jgi:IclR family transcriptional regulator, KDG regulon repressor
MLEMRHAPRYRVALMSERETSIRRGIEVLLSLATDEAVEQGGLSVTRISGRLEREKSQVSRALKALAEYGLVEHQGDGPSYRLGWRIHALAQRAGQPRLLEAAAPVLGRLVASLNERAHLSVLHGAQVLTVLSEQPGRAVEAVGWVGRTTPAYCTSAGQALLLDHDRAALDALLGDVELVALGPRTAGSVAELADRIAAARDVGYVVADEEFEQGLISVAAPVRDARGHIVASLNVSAPRFRFAGRAVEAGEHVRGEAEQLSAEVSRQTVALPESSPAA